MAALKCRVAALQALLVALLLCKASSSSSDDEDRNKEIEAARKESKYKSIDTTLLLMLMGLLILSVLTIWLFKVKRFRFMHETGVCMLYGLVIGFIIKYATGGIHLKAVHSNCTTSVLSKTILVDVNRESNHSCQQYSYSLIGCSKKAEAGKELEQKALFDPEIFFYVLLPPIIFYAGYDMKKRFFFRNIGAILTYAFVGTTVSCLVFGSTLYAFTKFATVPSNFNFLECLLFGALISATDPVTVLAIFHDLHVDVDLYALVFGESVMNDAVAIVLFRSIETYLLDNTGSGFQADRFFESVGVFIGVFSGSFFLGFAMGLVTALIMNQVTKLTHISDFPLLETALFFLLSWSTFLMAEAADLTGIVAVLFCGISQAHYTYNNLSDESKQNTKQTFALLNFLAENFIFSYMGLAVFTFESHQWEPGFISWTFLAIALGRFFNIYPLSFLLNLRRKRKISYRIQHMMFFSGLRGAVAFALAMRNTESVPRQMMLSTVLVVVLITVVVNGGSTMSMLSFLKIRVGVDPDEEDDEHRFVSVRTFYVNRDDSDSALEELLWNEEEADKMRGREMHRERAWLFRKWYEFDVRYMKPIFTNVGPPVTEILPSWCGPLAQLLTGFQSKQQPEKTDSDDNMIDIDMQLALDSEIVRPPSDSFTVRHQTSSDSMREGDLGLGAVGTGTVEA